MRGHRPPKNQEAGSGVGVKGAFWDQDPEILLRISRCGGGGKRSLTVNSSQVGTKVPGDMDILAEISGVVCWEFKGGLSGTSLVVQWLTEFSVHMAWV